MFFLGIALSLLIGDALGFFGAGGSILTVPLLVYVFGLPAKFVVGSPAFAHFSDSAGLAREKLAAVLGETSADQHASPLYDDQLRYTSRSIRH
jgi:hypothetical protein